MQSEPSDKAASAYKSDNIKLLKTLGLRRCQNPTKNNSFVVLFFFTLRGHLLCTDGLTWGKVALSERREGSRLGSTQNRELPTSTVLADLPEETTQGKSESITIRTQNRLCFQFNSFCVTSRARSIPF